MQIPQTPKLSLYKSLQQQAVLQSCILSSVKQTIEKTTYLLYSQNIGVLHYYMTFISNIYDNIMVLLDSWCTRPGLIFCCYKFTIWCSRFGPGTQPDISIDLQKRKIALNLSICWCHYHLLTCFARSNSKVKNFFIHRWCLPNYSEKLYSSPSIQSKMHSLNGMLRHAYLRVGEDISLQHILLLLK